MPDLRQRLRDTSRLARAAARDINNIPSRRAGATPPPDGGDLGRLGRLEEKVRRIATEVERPEDLSRVFRRIAV